MSDHTRPLRLFEAADLINVSPGTLRNWRHHGCGPRSFKIGRAVMYDRDDLMAWLDTQRAETTTGGGLHTA